MTRTVFEEKNLLGRVTSLLAIADLRLKYACIYLDDYTRLEQELITKIMSAKGYTRREKSADGMTDFIRE